MRSPTAERITIHRVRTNVLLWALGGFADDRSLLSTSPFTDEQLGRLLEVAKKPRAAMGELKALVALWERDQRVVITIVHRLRAGWRPRRWADERIAA